MPARKKTLVQLVRDRTFLARRHAKLLETAPLVDDNPTLRTLQASYRAEPSDLKQQALARLFESACRKSVGIPGLTMAQVLHASIGPSGPDAELERRWNSWDRRHGFAWRLSHDACHQGDLQTAYRRLTGKGERNLGRINERMPDILERARAELGLKAAPEPPGFELV